MIRVFARKTKWTPTDPLAFYGDESLYAVQEYGSDCPVYVSCAFTWDKKKAVDLARAWAMHFRDVQIGGPAFGDPGGEFVPGRFIKEGVTFTSHGCPKRCPGCLVPQREGKLRELKIQPGYIVQDNNLLACTVKHIENVFEMLKWQSRAIQFKGGLDKDFLKPWHVELLKKIKVSELWVACDRPEDLPRLDKAADLLGDFSIEKKRCYILVGMDGDTQEQAKARCIAVLRKGFLPFAQLFRGETAGPSRRGWHDFCYFWSKPGLYRKKINFIYGI